MAKARPQPKPRPADDTVASLASVPQAEALAAVRRALERKDFRRWLGVVSPDWSWDWKHLEYMRAALGRVTGGTTKRLLISMPPQHGKTEHNTVRYTAWRMEGDPGLRVGVACYDQKQAKKYSRKIRKIVRARHVPLSKERKAIDEWETRDGGSLKAVGVGSGIAGNPIDLLQIDDPVKSREEAESAAYRDRVWGWFAEDLMTRLQKDAACIITATRWHDDDVIGRILASEDAPHWEVINLPAEAEENDPLGRPPGDPLCRERFDTPQLEERKRVLGLGYYALYQGRPVPRGGATFKAEWFAGRYVPAGAVPALAEAWRHWDLAASLAGDWTAGVKMGRGGDGLFYVLDVVRGRWQPAERDRVIRDVGAADGEGVRISIGQDPGQAGKSQLAQLVAMLAPLVAEGVRETGSKETRADAFASQLQAGNVRIVAAPWNRTYESEFCLAKETKIATMRGDVPIEDVTTDDRVPTRAGWRRVLRSERTNPEAQVCEIVTAAGSRLLATPNHPIQVEGCGFIPAGRIRAGDVLLRFTGASDSYSTPTHASDTSRDGSAERTSNCTTTFGSAKSARCRKATTSTTRTSTPPTTGSTTSNASRLPTTSGCTWQGSESRPCVRRLASSAAQPTRRPGQIPKPVPSGAATVGSDRRGTTSSTTTSVRPVARISAPGENSRFIAAEGALMPLATSPSGDPCGPATGAPASSAPKGPLNAFVADVVAFVRLTVPERHEVFNLEVEDCPEFVANGLLVHNCTFPHGRYDDQVDATASCFHRVARAGSVYERRGLLSVGGNARAAGRKWWDDGGWEDF